MSVAAVAPAFDERDTRDDAFDLLATLATLAALTDLTDLAALTTLTALTALTTLITLAALVALAALADASPGFLLRFAIGFETVRLSFFADDAEAEAEEEDEDEDEDDEEDEEDGDAEEEDDEEEEDDDEGTVDSSSSTALSGVQSAVTAVSPHGALVFAAPPSSSASSFSGAIADPLPLDTLPLASTFAPLGVTKSVIARTAKVLRLGSHFVFSCSLTTAIIGACHR